MKAIMSITIPLPLMSPSSTSLRLFPLLLRRISLPSATTPPQISPILLTTTTFSVHSLSSSSQNLLHPLSDAVLAHQTNKSEYEVTNEEDKAVDSTTNLLHTLNDAVLEEETDEDKVVDFESEYESDDSGTSVLGVSAESLHTLNDVVSREKLLGVSAKAGPSLSVKEKKELASYAHTLGKKLKSQQVGKSGVTDTVITALIETLEKNELLKLKIHNNCPAELDDAIKQIEMGTGSVAVSQIGRTVILYRPSVSKLEAEQRKKLALKNLKKKRPAWVRSSSQSNEEMPKLTARGRRGSSRK